MQLFERTAARSAAATVKDRAASPEGGPASPVNSDGSVKRAGFKESLAAFEAKKEARPKWTRPPAPAADAARGHGAARVGPGYESTPEGREAARAAALASKEWVEKAGQRRFDC